MEKWAQLDQSVMKFRVSLGQKLLALAVFLSFLALSFSIVTTNKSSVAEAKSLTSAEAPAASIIFTQRETLVYTIRLTQWLDQQVTRRDVQIARALLAQRLAVINTDGKSIGEEAPTTFLEALAATDNIVGGTSPGLLTPEGRTKLLKVLNPEIENLVSEARLLVSSYQVAVDKQLTDSAKASRTGDFKSLLLLILFMALSVAWFGWIFRTSISQYRRSRNVIIRESKRLEVLASELAATNLMVFELESLNESKNEFISNISHELRTPLTSIIGYVDVLATSVDLESDPQVQEIFKVLDRNATILSSLVQSLLALSRLDSPHSSEATKPVDLMKITEDAIFILQPEIDQQRSKVTFIYDPETDYIVDGDSGLISQATINLIANAIKFSPQSSEIIVLLERFPSSSSRESISLSIQDFGIGIPQEEIPRLSERFYRASNAVFEHIQGTGLGLAIVAKVVERHNANLTIDSEIGTGTTFTIEFLAAATPVEQLVARRKFELLAEAITAIDIDGAAELKAKLHEYGGAIGFYEFPELGEELLALSRSITIGDERLLQDTLAARDLLIEKMELSLPANEKDESSVE